MNACWMRQRLKNLSLEMAQGFEMFGMNRNLRHSRNIYLLSNMRNYEWSRTGGIQKGVLVQPGRARRGWRRHRDLARLHAQRYYQLIATKLNLSLSPNQIARVKAHKEKPGFASTSN